jgi:hypothetical protein
MNRNRTIRIVPKWLHALMARESVYPIVPWCVSRPKGAPDHAITPATPQKPRTVTRRGIV